jgi:hypothetical protein
LRRVCSWLVPHRHRGRSSSAAAAVCESMPRWRSQDTCLTQGRQRLCKPRVIGVGVMALHHGGAHARRRDEGATGPRGGWSAGGRPLLPGVAAPPASTGIGLTLSDMRASARTHLHQDLCGHSEVCQHTVATAESQGLSQQPPAPCMITIRPSRGHTAWVVVRLTCMTSAAAHAHLASVSSGSGP